MKKLFLLAVLFLLPQFAWSKPISSFIDEKAPLTQDSYLYLDNILSIPDDFNGQVIVEFDTKHPENLGSFYPETNTITISPLTEYKSPALIHELGHYLDYRVLPQVYKTSSPWSYSTQGKIKLKKLYQTETIQNLMYEAFRPETESSRLGWIIYQTNPSEIFSRAFMQWVSCRKPNAFFNDVLDKYQVPTGQWNKEEFKSISPVISDILKPILVKDQKSSP